MSELLPIGCLALIPLPLSFHRDYKTATCPRQIAHGPCVKCQVQCHLRRNKLRNQVHVEKVVHLELALRAVVAELNICLKMLKDDNTHCGKRTHQRILFWVAKKNVWSAPLVLMRRKQMQRRLKMVHYDQKSRVKKPCAERQRSTFPKRAGDDS